MKKIIDGKEYNTDDYTSIFSLKYECEGDKQGEKIYYETGKGEILIHSIEHDLELRSILENE